MLSQEQRDRLAQRLRRGRLPVDDGAARGPLTAMNSGDGPPLFAFHAIAGTVFGYAPLARELAADYRVTGVEASGAPLSTLDDLAERYAGALGQAQPDGPQRLLGWSMGGVIAFETAVRLQRLGRQIALIVLVDAPCRTPASYADTDEGLAALFVADAARLLGGPAEQSESGGASGASGASAASGVSGVGAQLDRLAERLAGGPDAFAATRAELDRRFEVFRAHTSALAGYVPAATLAADAVIVRADGSRDSVPGWSKALSGPVVTGVSAGDHYTCLMPPAVGEIAALIRAAAIR